MPRNMSFALTIQQVRHQEKDVTRRDGWWNVKVGEIIQPVEKSMGFKKGGRIVRIGPTIQVISTRHEPLNIITPEDVIREGFPGWTPTKFVEMLVNHSRIPPDKIINRIEFKYMGPPVCHECCHELEKRDCWQCNGDGFSHHDCGEDVCCCLIPEDNVQCDICRGKGWHLICPACYPDND